MELFLIDEFADELQRRSDVLDGEIVVAADVIEGHAAGEATHDDGNGVRVPRMTGLP